MRLSIRRSLAVAVAALLVFVAAPAFARERVVAYVPNWIDLRKFAGTIDYKKLTHVNVAFENPIDDAGKLSFDDGDTFLIEAARAHGVKTLVSIGGGSASTDRKLRARYARALANAGGSARFASGVADYLSAHGFDGIDVDIEGPAITPDYGLLIDALAKVLKPRGKLLTAAVSKGYGGDHIPDSALKQFDFVNIMAYDGAGPWEPKRPGPHASIEFARDNVDYWLRRGLDRSRANLGLPFYGYGFGKAFRNRDYPYADILAAYPGAEQRDVAGQTIYYNGAPTIAAKCRYVLDQRLGGVMIWSLDEDAPGDASLLSVIHATLSAPTTRPATAPERKNGEE